ncbi:hypothetical protein ABPG74_001318 [Tetrahymena malaccensis]
MNKVVKYQRQIGQNLKDKTKEIIKNFIVEQSFRLLQGYDRTYYLSIFLLIFRQFCVLQFNFNDQLYSDIINKNISTNNKHIDIFIMQEWSDSIIQAVFFTSLALTSFLLIALAANFTFYVYKKRVKKFSIICFCYKIYPYIVYLPSIYSSLCMLHTYISLSILNMALTLIMQLVIVSLDFDFRFITKDFLAKRKTRNEIIIQLLGGTVLCILYFGFYLILPFLGFTFNLIKTVHYLLQSPFQSQEMQQIEFSLTITNMYISLIFILRQNTAFGSDFIILFLCCIPLSYFAGKKINQFRLKHILSYFQSGKNIFKEVGEIKSERKLEQIDFYFRFIYQQIDCSLASYMTQHSSIILEQIVTLHHEYCEDYPTCFCFRDLGNSLLNREELIGEEYRKQYLQHYILNCYHSFLKENKLSFNFFYYSYLAFIINGIQNENISFREIMRLQNTSFHQFKLEQMLMINYFFDLACSEFELDAMKIQIEQSEKLIDIILFDEDIENCNRQLKDCLNLKYEVLQTIGKDYINLKELEKQLQILLCKRVNLRRELIRLQKIHSLSSDLISLCEGFEECLTIDQDLTKQMQVQNNNRFGVKNYLLNYSDDSAAIYISLLSDIGKIVKVSKNFKDVVQLVSINQEAIGKNIKFLMPQEIAQLHDEILYKSMKERKQINYNIKQFPLLLGKDKDGWAIAYNLKVQTFMLGNHELGCCGLLKQIKDDNMYLMCLNKERNRIIIQDKKFFKYILSQYFSQSEAKKVLISSIIPLFKILQEKAVQGQQYETLLFQPQNIEEATQDFSTANKSFLQMVGKRKIFLIKFSLYQIENEIIQLTQLQVNQIKPLQDINSKKDALRNFKIQIQQYANETYLSELYDCLNSIIEKTDCEDFYFNTHIESEERSNFFDNTQKCNNDTEQCQKSEDNFIFIDSNNKISLNEEKLFSKPQNTLGQIQEETEQNSLCSPELEKRKVKIQQIKLVKNEQLIQNGRKPNLFDSQHPSNNIQSFTFQSQLQQGQSIGSLGTLATQKYLSTNNIQNQALPSEINSPQNLFSQESNHNQNILSSDSMHFSPKSSQRIMLEKQNEKDKYHQYKQDKSTHQNQLNTIEDEYNLKQTTRKRESTQSTNYFEIKNQIIRNKNTSTIKNRKTSELKINHKSSKQEGYSNNIRTPQNDGNIDDFKDEGSVKSSKSQRSQSKIQILSTIRKKGDSKCLKLINILGILSIIIICCLNLTIFELQLNFQYIQKINFYQINWTFSLKRFISIFFGNNFLILGLKSNFYQITDQNTFKKLGKLILGANGYMYQGYQNQTQQLIQGNLQDIYVFQEINNYNTELSIASITNSSQITNYTSHLTFKIAFFQTIGFYVASLLDTNQYNTQVGLQNFMSINSSLDEIFENNQNYQLNKIDNIKNFIFVQLIVISVVTGIFSCLSIPIYMFNMKKKEDILKLFATISPEKILQMMMQINKYLEIVENMESKKHRSRNISHLPSHSQLKLKNSEPQNIQNSHISADRDHLLFSSNQIIFKKPLENMKKKNISSTNSIKKFSFKLVIGILICFCFTLFYPVANYISSLQNIDTYQMNIYFLNAFDYLIDNITSLFCFKYSHTYLLVATKGKYPQLPFYTNTLKSQLSKTQSYLDKVMDNYQKYESYNGYMQSYYDNFMIPIVKDDICKTLNGTDPVYFREISFDYDNCVSCLNGIFEQGLVVMVKEIIQLINQYNEFSSSNNFTVFAKGFLQYQKQTNISSEYQFFIYQMYLSKIVHYFQEDTYNLYYEYNHNMQIWLISIQIVLLFFVAIFGWRNFYNALSSTYFQAKQNLDIIDINILVDNPYIISYFKKNI